MKTLLIPAGIMAAFILLISALTPQPQATAEPLITEVVQQQTGPGYTPPADASDCKCVNCNCDELEKRVAALEAKVAAYGSARPVVSNGSAGQSGGVVVSQPVTTAGLPYGAVVISERVVCRSPSAVPRMQMQPAHPVRNVLRGTCRIVNGVRVCN
jgi:hypothetical protein